MTKHADADKTVTHTSQPSKTIIRRDTDTDVDPAAAEHVVEHIVVGQPHHPPAPQPHADSPDANGPGQPQADAAHPQAEVPQPTRAAGETHHDADQATLDQLNGQLAAIRGLPQYADLERDLTERIAKLTASRA